VVDISDFMDKLQRVQPWLIRDKEKTIDESEYLQTPEQRASYPVVQPVRIRGKEVPHQVVWLAGFVGWITVSVGIGLVIL